MIKARIWTVFVSKGCPLPDCSRNPDKGCARLSSSTEIVEPMNLPTSKFAEIDAKVVCIFAHSIGTVTTVKQKLSFNAQWFQSKNVFIFLSERNETKISEKKIQRFYRDWFVLLDEEHNIDKKTSIVMEADMTSFPSLRNSTVSATVYRCLQAEGFSGLGQPYKPVTNSKWFLG